MKISNPWKKLSLACLNAGLILTVSACATSGLSGSDGSDSDSAATTAFPTQLAVASPFALAENSDSGAALSRYLAAPSAAHASQFEVATASIDSILSGTSPTDCTFDPEMFLKETEDASCFGPSVDYENHPEGSSGNSGELPPGDLGMWQEIDDATGYPCAAAQYNTRMEEVGDESQAALMGLASMVCVINTEGYAMPSSSVLSLTTDMNALGISGVTFTNASIGHNVDGSGNDQYTYNLRFEYDDGSFAHDIVIDMEHTNEGASDVYSGQLSYLVGDEAGVGNCAETEVTHNGSLNYDRDGTSDIALELRTATFCGANAEGRDVNGVVDASLKYPTNANGWSDDFNILTAEYDPDSLDGNYAFSWQAGSQDSNSRVFNLLIATNAGGATQTGYSFFGYGDDVETTDGGVDGFICNWIAPGSDHTILDYAQYQEVEYDIATDTFASAAANIGYAPTTDCEYDGSGSFIYDTNGDGLLTDETHAAIANDLLVATDVDLDGTATIAETIADTGYSIPSL